MALMLYQLELDIDADDPLHEMTIVKANSVFANLVRVGVTPRETPLFQWAVQTWAASILAGRQGQGRLRISHYKPVTIRPDGTIKHAVASLLTESTV